MNIRKTFVSICTVLALSVFLSGCFAVPDSGDLGNNRPDFGNTGKAPVTELPKVEYSEFCYIRNNGTMNAPQKIVYDLVYTAAMEYKTEVDITAAHLANYSDVDELKAELSAVIHAVFSDHPEIFWYQNGFTYTYDVKTLEPSLIKMKLNCEESEISGMQEKIDAAAKILLQEAEGLGEYEKSEFFYKEIVEKVEYVDGDNAHNIYGALVDGKAVCEGYAKAYQYLMTKSGVMTLYVHGNATSDPKEPLEAHGWNLVKINGNWYQTDCTWGDPLQKEGSENMRTVNYSYLNVTAGDLMGTHVMDKQLFDVPVCNSTEDNFYVKNGLYFEEFDLKLVSSEIKSRLEKMNAGKETELHIKFKKDSDAERAHAYLTEAVDGNAYFFSLAEGLPNRVNRYVVTGVSAGCFTFFINY